MVIMTAKVPKRRLLLIVLLLIAAAVVLALCLRGAGGETEKPAKTGTQGATNEARIAFLESYGWQVEPEPVKTQQVTVRLTPAEVFPALQRASDLAGLRSAAIQRQGADALRLPDHKLPGRKRRVLRNASGQRRPGRRRRRRLQRKTGVMHGLKMPE